MNLSLRFRARILRFRIKNREPLHTSSFIATNAQFTTQARQGIRCGIHFSDNGPTDLVGFGGHKSMDTATAPRSCLWSRYPTWNLLTLDSNFGCASNSSWSLLANKPPSSAPADQVRVHCCICWLESRCQIKERSSLVSRISPTWTDPREATFGLLMSDSFFSPSSCCRTCPFGTTYYCRSDSAVS